MEIAKSMFELKNKSSLNQNHILHLTAQTHTHMTRLSSKSNYFIPRKRTEYGKKSFSYIGPKYGKLYQMKSKHPHLTNLKKN